MGSPRSFAFLGSLVAVKSSPEIAPSPPKTYWRRMPLELRVHRDGAVRGEGLHPPMLVPSDGARASVEAEVLYLEAEDLLLAPAGEEEGGETAMQPSASQLSSG